MKYSLLIYLPFIINFVVSRESSEDCFYINNNFTGVCKKIEDCSYSNETFQELTSESCSPTKSNNYTTVCCPVENKTNDNVTHDCYENCGNLFHNTTQKGISELKCEEYSKIVSLLPRVPIDSTGIIDGRTGPGDYPHMTALGYGEKNYIKWQCLISARFILTAAHCIQHRDYGNVSFVRVGDIFLNSSSNTHQHFQVKRIIPHPDFKAPLIYHDIALIELNQIVVFTTYIQPACLNTLLNITFFYYPTIIGWGLTEYTGYPSDSLQVTEIQIFTIEECHKIYKNNSRKYPNGIINDMQICAGGRKSEKDACQGDSGGPLQLFNYNYFMHNLIGVTSFGKGCGIQDIPGIYTRVSHYIPWIESIAWS